MSWEYQNFALNAMSNIDEITFMHIPKNQLLHDHQQATDN